MRPVCLFLIFSFLIGFNALATSESTESSKSTTSIDFNKSGCAGSLNINNTCKIKKATPEDAKLKSEELNKKYGIDKAGINAGDSIYPVLDPGAAPEGVSCEVDRVTTCCSDPSACLGGEALSTFQSVSNVVSKVGPAAAMALQGFGKDMSGMCQAMQGLAGSGASLSLAASVKCKSYISSCHSACDHQIQAIECTKYSTAKEKCETACLGLTSLHLQSCKTTADNTFETEGKPPAEKIAQLKKVKVSCTAQNVKSKELLDNMGSMLNSAGSAELCKQQARATKTKEECEASGGKWKNSKCEPPEEKEQEKVSLQENNDMITQDPNGSISTVAEAPPSSSSEEEGDDNTDGGNNQLGGGGDDTKKTPEGESISTPYAGTSPTDTDSDEDSSTTDSSTGKSSASGRGLGLGSSYSGYNRGTRDSANSHDEEGGNLSMGGGGFAGYSGGGGSYGGSDSYASLGLSKKKLAELEKKQGAKRKTASETGGAHQNIFERISKRFQSLCQNKLDCQ